MVHWDIRSSFIVALLFGVAGHYANATLGARFVFSRPQQYLVKGERTSKDFLRCEGGYSNSSMKDVRVSVTFQGSTFTFIAPDASSYYMFNCTPQMMMPPKNGFAPVNAAFCVLGFKSAKEGLAGTYACRVASPSSYFHDAYVQLPLRVYDKFILNTTVQNRTELYVDEHQRFSLSCRVNLQKNLTDLELHLESRTRNGHFEKIEIWSLSSTKRSIYEYEVSSASRNDDGIYQCVIKDHTKVIDLGSRTAVRIRFAPVVNLFSSPIPIQKMTVTLDNDHTEDYLNCSVVGYPTNITITHNNASLVSIDQPNDTLVLKLSVADSKSGFYCCHASNALGADNTCLTVIVHASNSQWRKISVDGGIALGSGLLVLLIASIIFVHVKKKKNRGRSGSRRFSQIEDEETAVLLPTIDDQIDFVSGLFSESTWDDFRDFCRTIEPRFEEEPFIEDVTKKRAATEASDKDDAYWRKYCLEKWIEKYHPLCSFLQSVYGALSHGIKDKKLARKFVRRFPRLGLGESLEMSGLHSDSGSELIRQS